MSEAGKENLNPEAIPTQENLQSVLRRVEKLTGEKIEGLFLNDELTLDKEYSLNGITGYNKDDSLHISSTYIKSHVDDAILEVCISLMFNRNTPAGVGMETFDIWQNAGKKTSITRDYNFRAYSDSRLSFMEELYQVSRRLEKTRELGLDRVTNEEVKKIQDILDILASRQKAQ
jgi:hypothetical protein